MKAIEGALEWVFERFFCRKTRLIYDYVVDETSKAYEHLPSPEEINRGYPNPCGWGTGMEDSCLNAGTLIEGLLAAFEKTSEKRIIPVVSELLEGMLSLEKNGFVARSLSPEDGKSFYPESSRDQYTHFVWAAYRCSRAEFVSAEQKEALRKALINIAKKCEKEVKKDNNYQLLRADNSVGLLCGMFGEIAPHERMRLPMFYLGAFYLSGEEKYKRLYLEYRDEALEKSFDFDPEKSRLYAGLQMQYSLRLCYEIDEDKTFREKTLTLMKRLAEYGEERAKTLSAEYSKESHKEEICYRFKKWNEAGFYHDFNFGGRHYLNPAQSERTDNPAFYPVREVGEGAIMACLCPERKLSEELESSVLKMIKAIDLKKHSSVYAPLNLAVAKLLLE